MENKEDENIFVPLKGIDPIFEGIYEINKLGHIRNIKTGKIKTEYSISKTGYPRVSFRKGYFKRGYFVHRLVAMTFIPNPDNKPEVDHINRDTKDYSIGNLTWCNRQENLLNRRRIRNRLFFIKLDDFFNEIEKIPFNELSESSKTHISDSIKHNKKAYGFYWRKIDSEVEEYIKNYGKPKDDEWKESIRFPGTFVNKNGLIKRKDGTITTGNLSTALYYVLHIDECRVLVHRLVYETFNGVILKDGDVIDHIDTISTDNRLSNLRLTDRVGNMNNELTKMKLSKPVMQFSTSGTFIKRHESLQSATKLMKITVSKILDYDEKNRDNTIQLCCDRKCNTGYGYLWCWEGDEDRIKDALKLRILRYDESGNLVDSFRGYNSITNNNSYKDKIKKSIEMGTLCSDGYYYSKGPREF